MYTCDPEAWFQQQLSHISPLSVEQSSERDQCCFHVSVKVLSCFVFIIHVLPCLHLSCVFCYGLTLVSSLSCHWFIFVLCHTCSHLVPVLALILFWLVCVIKPFCVFVSSLMCISVPCFMFPVLCVLVPSSYVPLFFMWLPGFDLRVYVDGDGWFLCDVACKFLTPALNYDEYWTCHIKHNTESAHLHPASYTHCALEETMQQATPQLRFSHFCAK